MNICNQNFVWQDSRFTLLDGDGEGPDNFSMSKLKSCFYLRHKMQFRNNLNTFN